MRHRLIDEFQVMVLKKSELIIVGIFLSLVSAAYIFLSIKLNEGWVFDSIDLFRVYAIDDAYRYFIARSAWTDSSIYAWNYALPVGVVADGALASLLNGNVFLMRCSHALIAVMTLFLIYRTGRLLGVSSALMLISTSILAFMPLFALISLSFLGEFWYLFVMALVFYLFANEQHSLCAIASSLLPLVRPDGLFILIPLLIYFALDKKYLISFIMLVPGGLYFLNLLISLEGIRYYFLWRIELREALNILYSQLVFRPFGALGTFNFFWVLPPLLLWPVLGPRRLWPFFIGVSISLIWFCTTIYMELSYYEPRYFLFVCPLLVIFWGVAIQKVMESVFFAKIKFGFYWMAAVVAALVVADNLLQLDIVRSRYGNHESTFVSRPAPIVTDSFKIDGEEFIARSNLAEKIYSFANENERIDKVMVSYPELFLTLDPRRLPSRVKVIYIPVDRYIAFKFFGGSFFGMYPWGNQFSYFDFKIIRNNDYTHSTLFVGKLECSICSPVYMDQGFEVYHLLYNEQRTPLSRGN